MSYANGRLFLIVTPRQGGYRSTVFTLREADTVRIETATQDA